MARRRRHHEKKPVDKISLTGAIVSASTLIFFVLAVILSSRGRGEIGPLLPGLGALSLLLSLIFFILGFRERKREDRAAWSKNLGIIFPGLVLLVWLFPYLIGIIRG